MINEKIVKDIEMPEVLFDALRKNHYGGAYSKFDYSVTSLISGIKSILLFERHKEEIVIKASDLLASLNGSSKHYILERGNTNEFLHDIKEYLDNLVINTLRNNTAPSYSRLIAKLKTEFNALFDGEIFAELVRGYYKTKATDKYVIEQRFYSKVLGKTVSGGIDVIDIPQNIIQDYKFTKVMSWTHLEDKINDYRFQLSSYRKLLKDNNIKFVDVDNLKLQIIMIFSDWSKKQWLKNPDTYPPAVKTIDIEPYSYEEIEEKWTERIKEIEAIKKQNIPDDKLPICTPKERWQRNGTWVVDYMVLKGGNVFEWAKRPRTFVTKELAKNFVETHSFTTARKLVTRDERQDENAIIQKAEAIKNNNYKITFREGFPSKCALGYCAARDFCNYYQENKHKWRF